MRTRNTASYSDVVNCADRWKTEIYNYDSVCKLLSITVPDSGERTSFSYRANSYTKTITDIVTPHFHKRRKQGEIFNNPCTISVRTATEEPINFSATGISYNNCGIHNHTSQSGNVPFSLWYGGSMSNESTYLQHVDLPTLDVERLKNIAVTDAYSKIELSESQALATIAELEESIASIISAFSKAIKIFKAIRRKDLLALRGMISPKELADAYMEYRYGLRPIVYDVTDLISAISTLGKNFVPKRQTFRSRRSESKTAIGRNHSITPGGMYTLNFVTCASRTVEVSAGVLTDIEFLNAFNIFGLDQPFETVWELIPFSFIVDWFFNVGKTIAAFTPEMGVKNLASWVSVKETLTLQAYVGFVDTETHPLPYDTVSAVSNGSASLTVFNYTRTPSPTRNLLPSFDLHLDGFKLLDLAIILKQLIA